MGQLTLDGREVAAPEANAATAPFSPVQQQIMRIVREQGYVRPTQAGRLVHAARGTCGYRVPYPRNGHTARSCCGYCASDGWDALKRLRERGVLYDATRGRWVPVEDARWIVAARLLALLRYHHDQETTTCASR